MLKQCSFLRNCARLNLQATFRFDALLGQGALGSRAGSRFSCGDTRRMAGKWFLAQAAGSRVVKPAVWQGDRAPRASCETARKARASGQRSDANAAPCKALGIICAIAFWLLSRLRWK